MEYKELLLLAFRVRDTEMAPDTQPICPSAESCLPAVRAPDSIPPEPLAPEMAPITVRGAYSPVMFGHSAISEHNRVH